MSNFVVRLSEETEAQLQLVMLASGDKTKNKAITRLIDDQILFSRNYCNKIIECSDLQKKYDSLINAIHDLNQAKNLLSSIISESV